MEVIKQEVLLLKAPKEGAGADPYVEVLEKSGFSVKVLPVLSFNFLHLDELYDALSSPQSFSSLILTSPRVVQAMERALKSDNNQSAWSNILRDEWRQIPVFAIGQATARAAEKLGLQTRGENTGNAVTLAPQILQAVGPNDKPALLPCGNLRRETIPAALSEAGVSINSITVYETIPNPEIKDRLESIARTQTVPECLVYFSPSGIQFTLGTLSQLNFPLDLLKVANVVASDPQVVVLEQSVYC
ncbi:hypothetical protein LSAT2_005611 [Lamellibrachia satsuma]|nr:hypothetical protein LSAT2_005611 [Lamellibrachia satsuma]